MEAACLNENAPLLTIAIPTWNRAAFLVKTLEQLKLELVSLRPGTVEILVSDNCSQDETAATVQDVQAAGLNIRYVRNSENIGSDANIAQCFNLACGKYVLILGDDDLLVDGGLNILLAQLASVEWGVICLRPYGFDRDFREEYPGGAGEEMAFEHPGEFLTTIGPLITFISSCVINKELLSSVDARQFCGGNLVQVHLVIRAALAAKNNVLMNRYMIACKRNNSGGYDFSQVFVTNLLGILDQYISSGLSPDDIKFFEYRMMLSYYPYYLLRQRLTNSGDLSATLERFSRRFYGRRIFKYWLRPILIWPRPLALVCGAVITVIGRIAGGDFRRGLTFLFYRLRRSVKFT